MRPRIRSFHISHSGDAPDGEPAHVLFYHAISPGVRGDLSRKGTSLMGMPTEPLRDIMRRTIANLEFIERHAGPSGPYEVSQLLNSLLGALAHPWEVMRDDLMALPLTDAALRGWPVIQKERPSDGDPESLGDLIRLMRNGFAHGNIELLPGRKNEIRALRIWNNNKSGRRTWGTIITIDAARTFLLRFVELIEELHEKQGWYAPRTA